MLQHHHVETLGTKIVAPLVVEGRMRRVARLHPILEFENQRMIIAVDLAAAVPAGMIGRRLGSAAHLGDRITAALDLLFFGF